MEGGEPVFARAKTVNYQSHLNQRHAVCPFVPPVN